MKKKPKVGLNRTTGEKVAATLTKGSSYLEQDNGRKGSSYRDIRVTSCGDCLVKPSAHACMLMCVYT